MAEGFKIAEAFVQIDAKGNAPESIARVEALLKGIDDRIVQIRGEDDASPVIARVEGEQLDDKIVQLKAEDDASDDVAKVDGEKLDDKTVELKAEDKASAVIEHVSSKKPEQIVVPVQAEDKTEGILSGIGGKMKSWAGGLGLGVGGILAAGLAQGLQQANIVTGFENQMGVTEGVAEKYGQVAGKVFAQGFTTSKDKISEAISTLSSDMQGFSKLSQDEQAKISGKAVKLSENFGDLNTIMQAASNMVSNGLAPSFDAAFDSITVGMQNAGSRGDDLLETLREYSGYFAQLGFDGPQAISLVNQMMQAGAQDTDKAADAIKEFGSLAMESGGTATQAFQTLGFNVSDIQQKIAGGGDTAREAFIRVFQALQAVQDPAQRAQLAVQLFGTQSEDTMVRLIPKLDLGKLGMDNVAGATDRLKSTLTPMEQITNSFGEAMANLAPIIVPVIKIVSGIAGVLDKVAKGLGDILGMAPKSSKAIVSQNDAFEAMHKIMKDAPDDFTQIVKYIRETTEAVDGGAAAAQKYGISQSDMLGAVTGNASAVDKFQDAMAKANAAGGDDARVMNALNGTLGNLQRGYFDASSAVTAEEQAAKTGTDTTNKQADAHKNAAQAVASQIQATHDLEDAILGAISKDIAYRQSVQSTKEAQADYVKTLKSHKAGSQEAQDASMALESAQVRQAQAARDLAEANSKAADQNGRNTDGTKAYAAEVIKMAAAADGNATPALYRMISSLSTTELQANGVTIGVNKAGQAVYNLPGGKTVVMTADDQATRRAKEISDYVQSLPPFKTIHLTVEEIIKTGFGTLGTLPGSSPASQGRLADGGPVIGPGTETSDDVPLMGSDGEYMIRARAVRRYGRPFMDDLNNERLPHLAQGGPVGHSDESNSGYVTIHNHWNLPPDIDIDRLTAKVSRRMELDRRGKR
jgi:hypothetical protein